MTIEQLIAKFNITLVPPSSLRLARKPTAAQMEELKAKKPEIVDELVRREGEREEAKKREEEERQAKLAATIEAQRPLRKLAVCWWGGWESALECAIAYIVPDKREDLADWYKAKDPHCLACDGERIDIGDKDAADVLGKRAPEGPLWGDDGRYWLISEDEKAAILAKMAARVAEEKAQEDAKAAAEQAKVDAVFAEAKRTGEPMKLSQWTERCDGSVRDCSFDIVIKYAMPDGSTKTERVHTY